MKRRRSPYAPPYRREHRLTSVKVLILCVRVLGPRPRLTSGVIAMLVSASTKTPQRVAGPLRRLSPPSPQHAG